MDYKQAYFYLFNMITDVTGELKNAQIKAETLIINETKSAEKENIKKVIDLLPKLNNTNV